MNNHQNRRAQFRRYSDRRVAALLELHEVLFYEPPGEARSRLFLNMMNSDYQTDRAAIVRLISAGQGRVSVIAASEGWERLQPGDFLDGSGIRRIVETHQEFDGALTLSKFRSSSAFQNGEWQALWEEDLQQPASALLSVPIRYSGTAIAYLWLLVNSGSREWSSHDRDLSEEEASFLARVLEKKLLD
ncbi:MAG: GAF domain-containing protein [Deltaproteobacteria bacterium]|nr:GAF domain-containing protein [Deltaproteobacteria bacterium]MBN2672314.1 GAF domain-containing protein [Deltaproteobacteria bacterium]